MNVGTGLRNGVYLLAVSTILVGGCPSGGGNDNGNDNDALSQEAKDAVDKVVVELEATLEAVGTITAAFEGIDRNQDGTLGACPLVTVNVENGVFELTLDFGTGCTTESHGDEVLSGSLNVFFDSDTNAFIVTYGSLTIDGKTVTGSFSLQLERDASGRTLTGAIDLHTSGVGSADGIAEIEFRLLGEDTITIVTADLSLDDGASSVGVDTSSLVVQPATNHSFIPESGTISFEIPNDGPGPETLAVMIEFDSNSPVDGTVSVTVGSAEPVEYSIPGHD